MQLDKKVASRLISTRGFGCELKRMWEGIMWLCMWHGKWHGKWHGMWHHLWQRLLWLSIWWKRMWQRIMWSCVCDKVYVTEIWQRMGQRMWQRMWQYLFINLIHMVLRCSAQCRSASIRVSAAFSTVKFWHNASSHINFSRSNWYCRRGDRVKGNKGLGTRREDSRGGQGR